MFETGTRRSGRNLVLFLYIDFTIKARDIRGFIALLMDLPSIHRLEGNSYGDFIEGIETAIKRLVG